MPPFGDEIVAVVTHADDPRENLWFASVRDLAFENYLPVYQPGTPTTRTSWPPCSALQPDFLFSCYYRHMLKKPLLDLPRLGALNLHGSLLPRYRGRCPVNWVLIHGETETGVTLHYMEEKPDKGDIVGQKRRPHHPGGHGPDPVCPDDRGRRELMRETYPLLRAGPAPRVPQDQSRASYFGGRRPADGLISWDKDAPRRYIIWSGPSPTPTPGPSPSLGPEAVHLGRPAPGGPGRRPRPPPGRVAAALPGEGLLVATGRATSSSPRPSGRASRNFWGRSSPPGIIWWGKDFEGRTGICPDEGGHMGPPLKWKM